MACKVLNLKRGLECEAAHEIESRFESHRLAKRRRLVDLRTSDINQPRGCFSRMNSSSFCSVILPRSEEEIIAQLLAHTRRLQHSRRLATHTTYQSTDSSSQRSIVCSSAHEGDTRTFVASLSGRFFTESAIDGTESKPKSKQKEEPLFTLREVRQVCERMLTESEQELVEEYDNMLSVKMSEQYETFLKFNQDQLHRIFGEAAASYVS